MKEAENSSKTTLIFGILLKIKTADVSKILVTTYETIPCYNSDEYNLNIRRHENPKSHTYIIEMVTSI
jgi:hypothetical protein